MNNEPTGHEAELSQDELIAIAGQIVDQYFPADRDFFAEFDDVNDMLGAIYGQLLNDDRDPDEIFEQLGLIGGGW
jgi:hypothetical protein